MRPDVLYSEWKVPVPPFGTPSSPLSQRVPDHWPAAAAAVPSIVHTVSIGLPVPSLPVMVPVAPTPDFFNSTGQSRDVPSAPMKLSMA